MNRFRIFTAILLLGIACLTGVDRAHAVQPFEVVIMGDTQRYYEAMDDGAPDLFLMQTEWIRDHVASRNIAFVTQVGDVIQDNSSLWAQADLKMRPLDGAVPYSVTFGNHDGSAPGTFGTSRYTSYPWYLGSSTNQLAHAQTFTAGGFTFLHINLPHQASADLRAWAAAVIQAHPGKPTIISTHGYMADNALGRATAGNNIWNDLVQPYPQVFMTCCGHDWVTRHEVDTTTDGRKIIQLMVNWQQIINGGNGLLQLAKFDPDNGRIEVSTYSPYLDIEHTDFCGKFSIAATFNSATNTIRITHETGPTQHVWNGGGSGTNWQTAANWGGSVPVADRQLVFNGTTKKASSNNFPAGTRFSGIVFRPGTFSNGYVFTGNRLTLGGDIVNMGTYGPNGSPGAGPVFNLPLTLEGDRQINTGDWDMTLSGVIDGSGSLTKTHGRDYIGGSYDGGVYRGDLLLTAVNSYTGNTRVTGGALILQNASSMNLMPQSPSIELFYKTVLGVTGLQNGTFTLASGQRLKGAGRVMGKTTAPSGSFIEPGNSGPGTLVFLDSLTLQSGAALNMELADTTAMKYDRLDVTGSLALGGARLNLSAVAGFAPALGSSLILISNDGTDPVTGTLSSGQGSSLSSGTPLPQNTVIHTNFLGSGLAARISYNAGDGNDVGLYFFNPGPPVFITDPLAFAGEVGKNVSGELSANVSYGGSYPLTYSKVSGPAWLQVGSGGALAGAPAAGNLGLNQFTIQVSDGHGGTDTVVLQIQVEAAKLVGRWDFDIPTNLVKATVGSDLQFTGTGVQAIAGNGSGDGAVRIATGSYFRCTHGIGANGGGTNTNEYTLVFDIKSPAESASKWLSLFQTAPTNNNDAECFVRNTQRTIGISTTGYSTWTLPQETWTRIVVSVDNGGFYRIYANGSRILNASGQTLDGNFSLQSVLLLFADNDGEDNTIDVSSVRIYRTALTDTEVSELGAFEAIDGPAGLAGRWDFDIPNNLVKATVGTDLELTGTGVQAIVGNGSGDGAVRIGTGSYFRCTHGVGANGGGTATNEYTLVFDIKSPAESASKWLSLFQTSPTNSNDAECFVRSTQRTIGISGTGYSTWTLPQETWTRIAVSVDNGGFYRIYANGSRILNATGQTVDGIFSLESVLLLFADNDGEDNTIDVSSVRIYRTALTDAEVTQLGNTPNIAGAQLVDTDGDGMPDNWETANGFDPLVADTRDTDHDGQDDYSEYVMGSDSQNAGSIFRPEISRVPETGEIAVGFSTRPDRNYTLLRSETLATGDWHPVMGPLPGTGGTLSYREVSGTNKQVFFRIVVGIP